MTKYIGLDFETYGDVGLPTHGLDRYITGTHFRPLIAAVAWAEPTIHAELFDFVEDYTEARLRLIEVIGDNMIVAHNAGFEQAVLNHMAIYLPSTRFIDSAALARAAGAAGKLEAAAPQLLGEDKVETGWELIKLFSIPGKYQEASGSMAFDPAIRSDHIDEWAEFARYCRMDAVLSLRLAGLLLPRTSEKELLNNAVTMDMNLTGWHVDQDLVRNMQLRYLTNVANAESQFRDECDAGELNLNSSVQLKEWCHDRGVRATSFDEAHVASLIKRLEKKLSTMLAHDSKRVGYEQVLKMLHTKQVMGGSSLKKLQTIIDTVGSDGRLHDQYLHIGAGATYRTTGRGVQMQNLKRLNGEGDDMAELWTDVDWDNGRLAANLRQVFSATVADGFLIVGDFASVESRGLAWQAGEQWKLDAYFKGEDLYKVQAGLIFGKPKEFIDKSERQIGKVGELACGYGAGWEAVRDFASKMGVELSDAESEKLVRDWRAANPQTVKYWFALDRAMHEALDFGEATTVMLPHGHVKIRPVPAPLSLRKQTKNLNLKSLLIKLVLEDRTLVLERLIHGTHMVGNQIHYWKPSERKTGDLWTNVWMNPKTKRQQPFTVYGGKLSGLLTQSLCREVFFDSLRDVSGWVSKMDNVLMVGQFHDEIVLDWSPGVWDLEFVKDKLRQSMTRTILPEFPLAAEIKHDYRYTK